VRQDWFCHPFYEINPQLSMNFKAVCVLQRAVVNLSLIVPQFPFCGERPLLTQTPWHLVTQGDECFYCVGACEIEWHPGARQTESVWVKKCVGWQRRAKVLLYMAVLVFFLTVHFLWFVYEYTVQWGTTIWNHIENIVFLFTNSQNKQNEITVTKIVYVYDAKWTRTI